MNPDGKVGEHASCPNCGGLSFEPFEDVLDASGRVALIEICLACSALVNRGAIERVLREAASGRGAQVPDLHPAAFGGTLEEETSHFLRTLELFVGRAGIGRPMKELVSAEIGIGRGILLRAAAQLFARAYGTDADFARFEGTRGSLAVPGNVVLIESLSHLPEPADVILAWHTLERIPRLHDVVATVRLLLKPGGHFIFQVPLYRAEKMDNSRYMFMNRRSVAVLAELEGFEVVDMTTDHGRHFLSAVFRKPRDD